MEFGTLDFNNLVLLGIAVIGLINTVITMRANKAAKAANAAAEAANVIAVETRDIAQKTEANTNGQKEEREKMAVLFKDALESMRKARRK